jgi:glucose/arabinose dehydrogenase
MIKRTTLLLFILGALLLVSCGSGDTDEDTTPQATVANEVEDTPEMEETAEMEDTPEMAETTEPIEEETPEVMATEVTTDTAEATPTTAATEEAALTPTAAATEMATDTAGTDLMVGLELVTEGLTSPVGLLPAPDDSGRLYILDQVGVVYIIGEDGEMMADPFLDVRDRMVEIDPGYDERGLLGLAFHPDYSENGRLFVYYSAPLREGAPADWNHTARISEFAVSADNPDLVDLDSEQILLEVDKPQMNHNGGTILFGPDGYLYIAIGDGGGANDNDVGHVEDWYDVNEGGNGQDVATNLMGSILRIDVDGEPADGLAYAIPADNPFMDVEGAAEVWAIGFRNPYRMSFDMAGDNQLFVGDAGQDRWEEVSIVEGGGNYGWNVKEGTHCFSTADPSADLPECPSEDADGRPLEDPIIEYLNGNAEGGIGLVVIGGYVYRGSALADWEGNYIFGNWSTSFEAPNGALFVATPAANEGELWQMQELAIAANEGGQLGSYLLALGQDADGEVYILTTNNAGPSGTTGRVYRLVPADQ